MTGRPSGELQIVRVWCDNSAPTGESSQYECDDGSLWYDRALFESPNQTGLRNGHIINGQIILD